MKRGDLYLVYKGSKNEHKNQRVFLVVSRQECVDKGFSSVICAPVYTNYRGFSTQVEIGIDEGLKHDCAVFCDDLISLPKRILTNYIGHLPDTKIQEVNTALRIALAVE
jgi:mRNA interferase MazF